MNAFSTWENNTRMEKISVIKTVQDNNCLPVQLTKSMIYENSQFNVVHTTSFVNMKVGVDESVFVPPERC